MSLSLSVSLSLYLSFCNSSSQSLSSPDDELSENIWFVWSRTSYSGDKWRCHHADGQTSEYSATQSMFNVRLSFAINHLDSSDIRFYFLSTPAEKNTLQLRLPPCFPSFLQFPCCQAFQLSAPCFAVLSDKKESCELIIGCPSQYSRIIPTQYNYFFLLPDKPIFDSLHFCFFPLALHLISLNTVCAEKNH